MFSNRTLIHGFWLYILICFPCDFSFLLKLWDKLETIVTNYTLVLSGSVKI